VEPKETQHFQTVFRPFGDAIRKRNLVVRALARGMGLAVTLASVRYPVHPADRVGAPLFRRVGNSQRPCDETEARRRRDLANFLHEGDLPDGAFAGATAVAIDSETMGLRLGRDPLCVVQLSSATATPTWCAWTARPTTPPTSSAC
jgi:hypothetical protein